MPSGLGILSLENVQLVSCGQNFPLIPFKTCRVFIIWGFEQVISPRPPALLGYLPCAAFCNQTSALAIVDAGVMYLYRQEA